jgi:hypothetical protein
VPVYFLHKEKLIGVFSDDLAYWQLHKLVMQLHRSQGAHHANWCSVIDSITQ